MKKTVLLIHRGYPLGGNTGDKVRTYHMATSLNRLGYQVILLGFYTKGWHHLCNEKKRVPPGVRAIFLYSLPNRFGLAAAAGFFRALLTTCICKLYRVSSIQAEFASSATAARFVPEIPLVTDFHSDVVPELEMDHYPKAVIRHAAQENAYALMHSDVVVAVSESLIHNLAVYAQVPKQTHILPCNFNPEPYLSITAESRQQLRAEYGLTNRTVLCYSGGLHTWQCVKETIELVIRLKKRNPAYFFCLFTNDDVSPYTSQLNQLQGSCLVKGLDSSQVPQFLSMADVGFVLRANSLVNLNASPTKASEYLGAGAFVVTTRYAGDVPKQVLESNCGVVLDELWVDDTTLKAIDEQITSYTAAYASQSAKAKNYVNQNRTWASNEAKLAIIYRSLPAKRVW